MAYLNDGEPFYVPTALKGVPPMWPEAKEGDRVKINNGPTIKEYEFREGDWRLRATAYVKD